MKIKRFTVSKVCSREKKKTQDMAGQTFATSSERSKRSEYSDTQKVLWRECYSQIPSIKPQSFSEA